MSRFRNAIASRDAHILTLRAACGVLLLSCAALWWGWSQAPKDLTIHNPPDLRSGSTRKWWEVPPSSVYAFSFYIWQQLNAWHTNGEADYRRQIHALTPFFSADCKILLENEYLTRLNRQELKGRVRSVSEIPGRGYSEQSVSMLGRDTWVARLDLVVKEFYAGEPIRDVFVRYPLRVIRADTDPELNAFGLQIDCFEGTPQRLEVPEDPEDKP
ncbi:PFL_4703 family integrating conjugative element protein [Azotobacter vinelandii]|uniref:PFL_4703 family integrating conjugative element protein n=1 Tax=Azotobacter vinelandii TaxID=354 RepID=UPI000773380D|nr:TIGR03746 family integrating conjugative element protein [Azotobacter vinelandii]